MLTNLVYSLDFCHVNYHAKLNIMVQYLQEVQVPINKMPCGKQNENKYIYKNIKCWLIGHNNKKKGTFIKDL